MAVLASAILLLAGCLAPPRPQRLPPPARAQISTLLPTVTPTPTQAGRPPSIIESDVSETEPTPMAEATVVNDEASEPPSLLTKIGSSTRPNVAAALRLIEEGRALLAQDTYDRALDRFERALQIDPSNAYGYFFLARLHYQRHGYDQAIVFADKAAVLSARDDRPWMARAYALQGVVYEDVGRYPDARAAYRKALAADNGNLAAQTGMARLGGDGATR